MEIIARIHTAFPQKFGIPRQSGLVPELRGRIIFEPKYACEEAVRGLEEFTHIWLLWQFEGIERQADDCTSGLEVADEADGAARAGAAAATRAAAAADTAADAADASPRTWQPMVRPPLLGGNKHMGVFATRSPFRPNAIGLSCVSLERVEMGAHGPVLHVRGADLRDGTPIYDIKPYLPSTDCHPEASGGFTDMIAWRRLHVECAPDLLERIPADEREALLGVLAEDPRPARQRSHAHKRYTVAYAGFDVHFTVDNDTLYVTCIEPLQTDESDSL